MSMVSHWPARTWVHAHGAAGPAQASSSSGGHFRRQVHPVSHSIGGHNAREKCVRTSSDEEDEDPELELSSRGITAD
jgi:hypothetical protein